MRDDAAEMRAVAPLSGLSLGQRAAKRALDLAVAGLGSLITSPVLVCGVIVATVDTREWGVFTQVRIGQNGRPIHVHKLRTMRTSSVHTTTVTTVDDPRITRIGRQLRRFKIDELPQLLDVVLGSMSLVGPRPDVTGWADRLEGADRVILSVRPGITGPATLAYRHEERLLSGVRDPERHNAEVIWPDKVRINRSYVENWSLVSDLTCLVETLWAVVRKG